MGESTHSSATNTERDLREIQRPVQANARMPHRVRLSNFAIQVVERREGEYSTREALAGYLDRMAMMDIQ